MIKRTSMFAVLFCALALTACQTTSVNLGEENVMDDVVDNDDSAMMELPNVIKIGVVAPLTGSAAAYGQDEKSGVALYFANNPTIGDKQVELIYEDGKCNGQDASSAAQKLITVDKVQVIIGGLCSGETLAMAPIAEQNQVIIISPGSSSPEITTAGDYIFRNYISDDKVAATMVEEVTSKYASIAMITEQTDYGQGYRAAVKKHLEAAEKSDMLVVDEAFAVDNTDFRTLLTKVKESGAEVIVAIPQTSVGAGFIVKQAKELGLDLPVYAGDGSMGPDLFDVGKDAAEGFKVVVASEDPSREGYDETVAGLPEAQSSVAFQLFSYDAANLVANAIAEVGYDASAIRDYWYEMPTFKGVGGDVTFDENGDNQVSASIKVVQDGEFVLVTE